MSTCETSLIRPVPLDVLDVTGLLDYMRCMRYGMFKHLLGWRPPSKSDQDAYFGQCMHRALESLWCTRDPELSRQAFHDSYRARYGPESDSDFMPKVPSVFDRAWQMYMDRVWPRVCHRQLIQTEKVVRLTRPFPSNPFGMLDPALVVLMAKPDVITYDPSSDTYHVHEFKTSKYVDSEWWHTQWQCHAQIAVYLAVLDKLWTGRGLERLEVTLSAWKFARPPRLRQDGQPYASDRDLDCNVYDLGVRMSPELHEQIMHQVWHKLDQVQTHVTMLTRHGGEMDERDRARLFPRACSGEACCRYMQPCPFANYCTVWADPIGETQGGLINLPDDFNQTWWDPRVGEIALGPDHVPYVWGEKEFVPYRPDGLEKGESQC